jgi:hypothetical protein
MQLVETVNGHNMIQSSPRSDIELSEPEDLKADKEVVALSSSLLLDAATIAAAASEIQAVSKQDTNNVSLDHCIEILQEKAAIATFVKKHFPGAK